jgi:hypothetical protein
MLTRTFHAGDIVLRLLTKPRTPCFEAAYIDKGAVSKYEEAEPVIVNTPPGVLFFAK